MSAKWNPQPGAQADFFGQALGGAKIVQFRRKPLVDTARARNTDPETSHAAAKAVRDVGALTRQQFTVRGKVVANPGLTSAELAAHHAKLQCRGTWETYRPMYGRRLPELEGVHIRKGPPRICKVTGRMCVTWWPL